MGIAVSAPRGGLVEDLADAPRVMILRNAEIERFEDRHGGIFAIWDGFMGYGKPATYRQARDLVALGLVGGGMSDKDADRLVESLGPGSALRLRAIAQALIGVAFFPDSVDGGGNDLPPAGDDGKKTDPAPGGCG